MGRQHKLPVAPAFVCGGSPQTRGVLAVVRGLLSPPLLAAGKRGSSLQPTSLTQTHHQEVGKHGTEHTEQLWGTVWRTTHSPCAWKHVHTRCSFLGKLKIILQSRTWQEGLCSGAIGPEADSRCPDREASPADAAACRTRCVGYLCLTGARAGPTPRRTDSGQTHGPPALRALEGGVD